MGEGAGVLVLEDAEKARRARRARSSATVRGYGATSRRAPPDRARQGRRRRGRARSPRRCATPASQPEDVDYVNAHGTSTPLNDRAETHAIKAALGERRGEIPVSSTKSAIGHLLGAAGAVEAVATMLALRDRIAPPTLGYEEPEEGLDLDYVPGAGPAARGQRQAPPSALSNSFGFGGHNAVLCLEAA